MLEARYDANNIHSNNDDDDDNNNNKCKLQKITNDYNILSQTRRI